MTTPQPAPLDARRTLTDAQGREWTVHERHAPRERWTSADLENHNNGYGAGWLIFECEAVRKRLRLYPAAWDKLPTAALARLCERALPYRGD
jgi:hypothetical protein